MNRPFLPKNGHRFIAEFIVLILLALIAGTGLVVAQDATAHKIAVGQTVTGTLDATTFAQVYTFDAKNGDSVTLTATSQTQGLFLAMVLSGPDGNVLSQSADLTKAAVSLSNIAIAADGTYTVTVLRATGAQGAVKGTFTLALTSGSAQPVATQAATASASAATVTLSQGLSVALSWGTTDDMNLEVRDPIGGDVSHNSPATASGGRLSNDVNANCATATADNPTENISWPAGNVPSGSYEIIVYYNQACAAAGAVATQAATASASGATAAPTGGEVNFAISVTINGDTREPIRGTLSPTQQYVASFVLTSADQVTIFPGGVLALDLAPFANKLGAPKSLNLNTAATGTTDHNNAADAWSFQVTQANTPITITMNATSGSLDTFLALLGANDQLITSNDDANNNTRNSQIVNQTLAAGRYTVVATRFALQNGGTEGNYSLNVSSGRATANNTTTVPTVAPSNTTGSGANASLPAGNITVALSWNTRADLRLLIRDPNGVSVFSDNVSPDNSGILDRLGNFKCQNVNSSPLTYAYWPTNQTVTPGTYEVGVWQSDRCTDQNLQPQYTLVVNVLGKEVIRRTDRPDPKGLHLLTTFTVDAAGNATAGGAGIVQEIFNEDISAQLNNNPPALSFGTAVNGTIDANNPFVLYTFTAKSTDRVAIAMRNTAGNLDPNLFLLDSTGKVIASNDDQDPGQNSDSRIEVPNATLKQFPADGTYVVVATRYGVKLGGTAGNYELTIAQLNQ